MKDGKLDAQARHGRVDTEDAEEPPGPLLLLVITERQNRRGLGARSFDPFQATWLAHAASVLTRLQDLYRKMRHAVLRSEVRRTDSFLVAKAGWQPVRAKCC